MSALLLSTVLVSLGARPAGAATFTNSSPISIPSNGGGFSTPYPSGITVSGLSGTIVDVNVTLSGVTHGFPDDIDVLLVGPTGADMRVMTDAGDSMSVSGVNLTFDDAASGGLPDEGQITSGTYDPTTGTGLCNGYCGGPPAPAGPYASTLATFNGTAPNGTWNLFVFDDFAGDGGSISGGWSLEITTTAPTISSFNPTSGPPGTSVQINGTNFTGATSVTFNGVPAAFVVNSSTQITATVPAAATTGPIAVTTPSGTATSASNFTVIPPPTITSFSPGSGKVGTAVTIIGTTLTGATNVSFNGVGATFAVNSSTQVTATVPPGASTGPIAVTTASGTGTSAGVFVVKHAREVSLHFSVARGNVTVLDGFNACRSNVPVKLQHRVNGRWRTVSSDTTNPNGSYNLGNQTDPGAYRTLAKKFTTASGDVCLKKKSPVATL